MSLQPVSMVLSNLNLESAARVSPNAQSAVQDTGQSQEIIRDGIRAVQTVQASDAAAESQRVHRKDSREDQQEGQGRRGSQNRDSFILSKEQQQEQAEQSGKAAVIHEREHKRKHVEFLA